MNSLSETMEDIVKNKTGLKIQHLFPFVLHQILSEPKFHDIITWLPHGRSFKVLDRDKFIDDVAHEFFSFNKYRSIICDDKSKKLVEVVPSVKETKHVSALSSFNRVQDRPASLCTGETKNFLVDRENMVSRGLMVINEPTSQGRVSEEMKQIHSDRENTISRGLTLNDLPVNLFAASGETENILYDREHMISRGIRLRDRPLNLCRASVGLE